MMAKTNSYNEVFKKDKYKVIVLDMDGTLYYQRKMQFLMCIEMGAYAIRHPFSVWKFRAISLFRNIRERSIFASGIYYNERYGTKDDNLLEVQYRMTADRINKTAQEVAQVIEEWLFKRPLKYMQNTCDAKLCEWIAKWKKSGKRIVIYSDYPVMEKCDILGLDVDKMFSSEDKKIGHMKPSVRGLEVISQEMAVLPEEILVIGDRMSKDGMMAEEFGCDYVILEKWKIFRNRYYDFHNF